VKHDRTQARLRGKAPGGRGDGEEHLSVKRVVLVASHHRDLGHVIPDIDADAFV
jgi:hypothetical protein